MPIGPWQNSISHEIMDLNYDSIPPVNRIEIHVRRSRWKIQDLKVVGLLH